MKRRHLHLAFALAATMCGAIAVYHAARLQQAERVNAAIANAGATGSQLPEARFARAAALAQAGQYDAALKAYKALAQNEGGEIRRSALFNLGNLNMREALKKGGAGAVHALPLVELAKQSYRDLLRLDPGDWDARYNLERALWLAPEVADEIVEDDGPPIEKERALTTMQAPEMELP